MYPHCGRERPSHHCPLIPFFHHEAKAFSFCRKPTTILRVPRSGPFQGCVIKVRASWRTSRVSNLITYETRGGASQPHLSIISLASMKEHSPRASVIGAKMWPDPDVYYQKKTSGSALGWEVSFSYPGCQELKEPGISSSPGHHSHPQSTCQGRNSTSTGSHQPK